MAVARAVDKYLARWAEPEARAPELEALAACGPWDHALVLPARRETAACLDALAAPAGRASVLCVLVVNAGDDPDDQRAGVELLETIEANDTRWRGDGISLLRAAPAEVLLVDRCRGPRRFLAGDGVGLARKLGADLALALWARGALRGPWIHTTDADARLPAEHFERAVATPDAVAATVAPFRHVEGGDAEVDRATARYELSLRYYVAGLRHAGSAYAFHTIGSLISARCSAYARARGFPQRAAGEDFYLLNKLAKLGEVRSLGGEPVRIQSRRSTRVPFGTGPAVEALLAGEALAVYDPRVFDVLGQVLRALERLARGQGLGALERLTAQFDLDATRRCLAAARDLHARYPQAQLRDRLHESFDGFRTLKLIHELTAARWPKRPWPEAAAAAPFLDVDPAAPLEVQRAALAAREHGHTGQSAPHQPPD